MSHTTQAKPKKAILDPKVVKRELFERGWSQARLAIEVNASVTAVNGAINHGFFPGVTAKIKRTLGL